MTILQALLIVPLLLAALPAVPALAATTQPTEIQWHDGATFGIEGAGWTNEQSPYYRFPASAQGKVSDAVWDLGQQSAGLCIRFVTDSKQVMVRWDLTGSNLAMPHMPATGVSGVDLYCRKRDGSWIFVKNGRPEKQAGNEMTTYLPGDRNPQAECMLYLPLYNGVKKLEIGVPTGRTIEKAPARPEPKREPIVYYGTSIAQGGCASRPGMAFTAIIGRALDRPVINLGFSGSGRMESSVADLLAELHPRVYVIACLWNMGNLSDDEFTQRLTTLISTIRKTNPVTPILFVGQSQIQIDSPPPGHEVLQEKVATGMHDANIHTLPGHDLMGFDGEGTVDGCHPNDLGMMRQAQILIPVLEKLVR